MSYQKELKQDIEKLKMLVGRVDEKTLAAQIIQATKKAIANGENSSIHLMSKENARKIVPYLSELSTAGHTIILKYVNEDQTELVVDCLMTEPAGLTSVTSVSVDNPNLSYNSELGCTEYAGSLKGFNRG
jgi:hypothetical protein